MVIFQSPRNARAVLRTLFPAVTLLYASVGAAKAYLANRQAGRGLKLVSHRCWIDTSHARSCRPGSLVTPEYLFATRAVLPHAHFRLAHLRVAVFWPVLLLA